MDITNKKPKDVIKPEYVEAYAALHKDICDRLTHLNTNITILETIQNFPFHHFYAPHENIFWTMVYWNFLHMSEVLLYTLVSDDGKDAHTLLKFKSTVLKHLLTESLKTAYHKKLSETKLSKQLKPIRKKIAEIRNAVIAHRLLDEQGCLRADKISGVSLSELRAVFEDVEKLFEACCFGSQYISNLYTGGTVGGKPVEKDIDNLLDLIVKDSYWLNEPECNKPFWPAIKQHTDPQEVDELNVWRRKFGLPDA